MSEKYPLSNKPEREKRTMNRLLGFDRLCMRREKTWIRASISMFPGAKKEPSRNETRPLLTSFCCSSLIIQLTDHTKVDVQDLAAQVTEQVAADEHQRISHFFRQARTAVPTFQKQIMHHLCATGFRAIIAGSQVEFFD